MITFFFSDKVINKVIPNSRIRIGENEEISDVVTTCRELRWVGQK